MTTAIWRTRLGIALLLCGAVAVATAVGYAATISPIVALALAAVVVVLSAAVLQPALVPVLAMPLSVVVLRAGGGGVDMTVSDVALGLAFWPAVLLSPKPFSKPMRQLLWLNAGFQAATLLTVIFNPYAANAVEWLHAWLLVSGALIVGWAVGRAGFAKAGLTLFLLACLFLAACTIGQGVLQWAGGNISAVYPTIPFPMHKNFIGTLLGFAAVVAYVHPSWMGWPRRWALTAFWILTAAIGFSQSRQAVVGLGVALIVITLRSKGERRRSRMILLALIPAIAVVSTLVRDQVQSGNVHNSVFQRLTWFSDTISVWVDSPWLGQGLRYWTAERTEFLFQPPNAFLEQLASTGVVGLTAFVVFLAGTMVVLWRCDPAFGTLAAAAVLCRIVQGQLDLFWISIGVSVPFLIAGVSLGAAAFASSSDQLDHLPEAAAGAKPALPVGA